MNPTIPASTKIKASRVQNIETERLIRRLDFLCEHGPSKARNADARIEVRMLAREIICISRELHKRGIFTCH